MTQANGEQYEVVENPPSFPIPFPRPGISNDSGVYVGDYEEMSPVHVAHRGPRLAPAHTSRPVQCGDDFGLQYEAIDGGDDSDPGEDYEVMDGKHPSDFGMHVPAVGSTHRVSKKPPIHDFGQEYGNPVTSQTLPGTTRRSPPAIPKSSTISQLSSDVIPEDMEEAMYMIQPMSSGSQSSHAKYFFSMPPTKFEASALSTQSTGYVHRTVGLNEPLNFGWMLY